MDNYYQEVGRGKYHVEYHIVKLENAVSVVYTDKELQAKYGTKDQSFSVNVPWYKIQETYVKIRDLLADALEAFKNPKVKFFPVDLPVGFNSYYAQELRDIGLGYTMSRGGGLIPKPKTDYTTPNKTHLYNLKRGITWRMNLMLRKMYNVNMDFKLGGETDLTNFAVLAKKLGMKKIPPMSLYTGDAYEKKDLEGFIQDWLDHDHKKYNNPKAVKYLAKEIRTWWAGCKEVVR